MKPIFKNKVTYSSKNFKKIIRNPKVFLSANSLALKYAFRNFFETTEWNNSIVEIPIRNFEITSINFKFNKSDTIMIITLGRPGLLIGKAGKQFDTLQEYLTCYNNDIPVKIEIIESKIWSY